MKSEGAPLNILGFKLITQILDPQSSFAKHEQALEGHVGKYTLLIPYREDREVPLSKSVIAYGVAGGNKLIQIIKMYFKARTLIRQHPYDVVTVADSYYVALLGLLLARKYHMGFEVQVHGFEKFYGLRALIAKKVIPKADVVRVASIRLKKLVMTEFGVPEEKITVAPVFFEDTILAPRSVAEQLSSGKLKEQIQNQKKNDFIFLTVGRLVPVKNITLQIQALKNILTKYPDTQLWIIGDGPERTVLEKKVKDLELSDKVIFWDWQSDLAPFYSNADSFLLSSDSEGWGLVVVEAAAFQLPILMTDVGCAGEFIHEGINGLIVPIRDQGAYEAGMLKLRAQEGLRGLLGRAAKDSLGSLPSKDELIQRYVSGWGKASLTAKENPLDHSL